MNGTDYEFTCDESFSLEQYGRLYNGYAVVDSRGLCPLGWHIPSSQEWNDLNAFVESQGFDYIGGIALKANAGWPEGTNGTDDFGFSALPGGHMDGDTGGYWYAGTVTYWWSSTSGVEFPPTLVTAQLSLDDYWVPSGWEAGMQHGLSVRCIAD